MKGFSGAKFKKFKSQQEAEVYIGARPKGSIDEVPDPSRKLDEPAAKRPKTNKARKHFKDSNFSEMLDNKLARSSSKADQNIVDTVDATIVDLDECPNKQTFDATESEDEIFMKIAEYPDQPSTSAAGNSSKTSALLKTKTCEALPLSKATPSTNKDPSAIKYEPPLPTTEKFYNGHKFQEDAKGFVHVYTDGSCESNGKFTAAAGLGVYFGENHSLNASDPVEGKPTNNAGEIQAAIRAIQDAQNCNVKRLNIFTDSHFLINSACKWMVQWKRKDWRLATGRKVVNQKDFKRLDELIETGNMLIKWSYIPAHKGYHGNEEADRLAKIGASRFRYKKKGGDSDDDDLFDQIY